MQQLSSFCLVDLATGKKKQLWLFSDCPILLRTCIVPGPAASFTSHNTITKISSSTGPNQKPLTHWHHGRPCRSSPIHRLRSRLRPCRSHCHALCTGGPGRRLATEMARRVPQLVRSRTPRCLLAYPSPLAGRRMGHGRRLPQVSRPDLPQPCDGGERHLRGRQLGRRRHPHLGLPERPALTRPRAQPFHHRHLSI